MDGGSDPSTPSSLDRLPSQDAPMDALAEWLQEANSELCDAQRRAVLSPKSTARQIARDMSALESRIMENMGKMRRLQEKIEGNSDGNKENEDSLEAQQLKILHESNSILTHQLDFVRNENDVLKQQNTSLEATKAESHKLRDDLTELQAVHAQNSKLGQRLQELEADAAQHLELAGQLADLDAIKTENQSLRDQLAAANHERCLVLELLSGGEASRDAARSLELDEAAWGPLRQLVVHCASVETKLRLLKQAENSPTSPLMNSSVMDQRQARVQALLRIQGVMQSSYPRCRAHAALQGLKEHFQEASMDFQELYALVDKKRKEYIPIGITLGALQAKAIGRKIRSIKRVIARFCDSQQQRALWCMIRNLDVSRSEKLGRLAKLGTDRVEMQRRALQRVIDGGARFAMRMAVHDMHRRMSSQVASSERSVVKGMQDVMFKQHTLSKKQTRHQQSRAMKRVLARWTSSQQFRALWCFREAWEAFKVLNDRRAKAIRRALARWKNGEVVKALEPFKEHIVERRLNFLSRANRLQRILARAKSQGKADVIKTWNQNRAWDNLSDAEKRAALKAEEWEQAEAQHAVRAFEQLKSAAKLEKDRQANAIRRVFARMRDAESLDFLQRFRQTWRRDTRSLEWKVKCLTRVMARWRSGEMQAVFQGFVKAHADARMLELRRKNAMRRAMARMQNNEMVATMEAMTGNFKIQMHKRQEKVRAMRRVYLRLQTGDISHIMARLKENLIYGRLMLQAQMRSLRRMFASRFRRATHSILLDFQENCITEKVAIRRDRAKENMSALVRLL